MTVPSPNKLQLAGPLVRALAFCQMIEESLRLYVGTAEQLIEAAVPYGVPYKVDARAIKGASLGKLIDRFAKLNRNTELIGNLRKLPEHRNHIAHAAFFRMIRGTNDPSYDPAQAKKHAQEVGDFAEALLKQLAQEMRSLLLNFPNSQAASAMLRWEDAA